jgi:hypothetical protein
MVEVRLFPLAGAQDSDPEVARWFERDPAPLRSSARKWFRYIRAQGPDVRELLHDGHPTACVDGIALAYVDAFKDHINVGFFLGSTINDPAGILEGTGRYMRHVKVRPAETDKDAALFDVISRAYKDLRARLDGR